MMGEIIFPLTILIDGWGARQLASETKNRMNVLLDIRKTGVGLKNAEVRT